MNDLVKAKQEKGNGQVNKQQQREEEKGICTKEKGKKQERTKERNQQQFPQ